MASICVVGAGHAGLVTAACFAELGHRVSCLDMNSRKIEALEQGTIPFFVPVLEEMVRHNLAAGRLSFTTSYGEGLGGKGSIFIAVNTPSSPGGRTDLRYLYAAAREVAGAMEEGSVVVIKSTVPVGTTEGVGGLLAAERGGVVPMVFNPEFLSEGTAIEEFMKPARIIIGSGDLSAAEAIAGLHNGLKSPVVICSLRTAELIKYAHNAFLATRISFINEIASISEGIGADVQVVSRALGLDSSLGQAYLKAGLGWGGSCLPKDMRSLIYMAKTNKAPCQVLKAVVKTNNRQRAMVVEKLHSLLGSLEGRVVGLLGLAFKPNTEDMREAPSLEVIRLLEGAGSIIKAYDPKAMSACAQLYPRLTYCSDPYELAQGCDALLLVTEWEEFRHLDMPRVRSLMKQPIFVDGRNLFEPEEMARWGFIYRGIGLGFPALPVAMGVRT